MTSVEPTITPDGSTKGVTREAWVKPVIESFEPVSATESVTSTNPGDIVNSNS